MQRFDEPLSAIQSVPAGAWAVGVSGGADSVALLSLLRTRPDLQLRVVHLDHQTRNGVSLEDARFVEALAGKWNLPCDVARLDEILPSLIQRAANRSALFRAARLQWFGQVVAKNNLAGVILAHHADDQAETVMLRLLRGSGYAGLAGMSERTVVRKLTILRPLLNVSRLALREHLVSISQTFREDETNASPRYARNRVRLLLTQAEELSLSMIELRCACEALRRWTNLLPELPETIPLATLSDLPTILARQQARRWLLARGAEAGELVPAVLDRLIAMSRDRAAPRKQQFPGNLTVLRRAGALRVG